MIRSTFQQNNGSARRAFTLVELMVTIGIIGVLIAILLPAVGAARKQAKSAAVSALITTLSTGLEQYKANAQIGGSYPPSTRILTDSPDNTVDDGANLVGGATFLVWALAGADFLGSPGLWDTNGNQTWQDDTGKSRPARSPARLYDLDDNNQPARARAPKYVSVEKMRFPKRISAENSSDVIFEIEEHPNSPDNVKPLQGSCFLDDFDQPILYYRATPRQKNMVMDKPFTDANDRLGVFNLDDNANITASTRVQKGMDFGAKANHPISALGPLGEDVGDFNDLKDPSFRGSFAQTIWNPNVTSIPRPYNDDSYILLSAGPDGLYGTGDDIANFPINK